MSYTVTIKRNRIGHGIVITRGGPDPDDQWGYEGYWALTLEGAKRKARRIVNRRRRQDNQSHTPIAKWTIY